MSADGIDRAACPLNSSVPHPRVVFHNVNSISNYASQPRTYIRHNKILKHITSINKTADIVCLQETHTATDEKRALSSQFAQTHLIFYINLYKGRAGVITLVNRRFASGFDIAQVPLDPSLDGRALALNFNSKHFPNNIRASFTCVNLYLTSGNKAALRIQQLETLEPLLDPRRVLIIGGDFNMVDQIEDRAGSVDNILKGPCLEKWNNFLDKLQLREVHQTSHTHFTFSSSIGKSNSAKLDRIYTSLWDSEIAALEPQARIHFASGSDALKARPGPSQPISSLTISLLGSTLSRISPRRKGLSTPPSGLPTPPVL